MLDRRLSPASPNSLIFVNKFSLLPPASIAFDDPNAQTIYDDYHSTTEDRYILLGAVESHILFVIYTVRGEEIRMISARPATKREEGMYYNYGTG